MNKEEYKKKKDALTKQLNDLREEYVKSNSAIPNNTKVKITRVNYEGEKMGVDYGFLVGYTCHYDDIIPIIKKFKKDGTPSMVNYWCPNMGMAIIEAI